MTRGELVASAIERAAARVRRAWCQGSLAKDRLGHCVTARHPDAVRWCVAGAVDLATDPLTYYNTACVVDMINTELRAVGYHSMAEFNDVETRTAAHVVALLTRAAARAREEIR